MKKITFKVTGVTPLLMHSDRYSNPLDPMTKKHKSLTGVLKKTDDIHEAIAISEWRGGLYYDDDIGVYVPGDNFVASLVEGARQDKLGKAFTRSVILLTDKCKLTHKYPGTLKQMEAKIEKYSYTKSVVVSRARIMRVRPIFHDWSFECSVMYDEEAVNRESIVSAAEKAGNMVGICDWRPRFGRFTVEVID